MYQVTISQASRPSYIANLLSPEMCYCSAVRIDDRFIMAKQPELEEGSEEGHLDQWPGTYPVLNDLLQGGEWVNIAYNII